MKCSLGISNFLEEISSLSHSLVFLSFFALIAEKDFLISSCYSLELCVQMLISFLLSSDFCFSSFHSYLYGLLRQPFCFFALQGQGRQPRGATPCPRSGGCVGTGGLRGATPRSRSGGAAVRRYPWSKARSSGYTLLEQL